MKMTMNPYNLKADYIWKFMDRVSTDWHMLQYATLS